MSLILTGNASNVTGPLAATVTALANNGSGAIRVATQAAHLFGNGDRVWMNAAPAVGFFTITVIDSTHFDLQGSTYTATGTGLATDYSLTPQIQVPTDGDTGSLQLSGMLSTLQGLCDRSQYLRQLISTRTVIVMTLTGSQTIIAPANAVGALVIGCGGGGGGGGGFVAGVGTSAIAGSGSGGGGAPLTSTFVSVTAGASYDVTIGTGGTGGATGGDGSDGTSSYLQPHGGGATFGVCPGGAGGWHCGNTGTASTTYWVPGGAGVSGGTRGPLSAQTTTLLDPVGARQAGAGGASMVGKGNGSANADQSYAGAQAAGGNGGNNGSTGATSGSYWGGAGGGGGGAGPYGVGANAGAGGAAASAGTGGNGTAGSAAAANSGAGGGGGGGGGAGSTAGGSGGAGGTGGSGYMVVVFTGSALSP